MEGTFCCVANTFSHNRTVFIACFRSLNFLSIGYIESNLGLYMYIVEIIAALFHRGNQYETGIQCACNLLY